MKALNSIEISVNKDIFMNGNNYRVKDKDN